MRARMQATNRNKFLPFDKYHVAPIGDIDPDSLKKAAKLACTRYRDDERLRRSIALNHIAQSLGFRGGFGGYRKEYRDRLAGFMKEQGLVYRRDVLALRAESEVDAPLTYRQIADRLFCSGLAAPERIFVGIDVFDLLKIVAATDDLKVGRGTSGEEPAFADVVPAEITSQTPPASYFIAGPEGTLPILELMFVFRNLLGDQLCDGGVSGRIVAQFYGTDDAERNRLRAAGQLLRRVLNACPSGWVEIVPYNDGLTFLKAPDGGYEFVFKRLRDAAFRGNIYYPYLRDKDVSKSEDANDFTLHLYFKYCGWLEEDRHEAEKAFYANGGSTATYPGEDEVLKTHLIRNGRYCPTPKKAPRRRGYSFAERAGHRLCFSELITVERFKRFLQHNPDYVKHRRCLPDVEPLEAVNNDPPDLPAAVTWYDARAYARWMKRTHKLPVRLPTEDEYLALAADLLPDEIADEDINGAFGRRLCAFFDPQGEKYDGHPPFMPHEEFAQWELRYDPDNIAWGTSETGLRTLRSTYFGEWLLPEGAAINGLFMCSQYDVALAARTRVSATRGRFSPSSTGKYKSMKIGFRLVYEAQRESGK